MTDLSGVNDEEMLALKRPIIDACIKSAQKNGWSDAMGLLRGTLFLESEPMSLDTLAEKTGYSKTTVRSNMNFLKTSAWPIVQWTWWASSVTTSSIAMLWKLTSKR